MVARTLLRAVQELMAGLLRRGITGVKVEPKVKLTVAALLVAAVVPVPAGIPELAETVVVKLLTGKRVLGAVPAAVLVANVTFL